MNDFFNASQVIKSSQKVSSSNEVVENVLIAEAHALWACARTLPLETQLLVERFASCAGHIIFSGLGKSGFIARKLAATFSSLGLPSLFLHPVEALHGDLGLVRDDDMLCVLSKSGSGDELETIIKVCSSRKIFTSLLCCGSGPLAPLVECFVRLPFTKEACHLDLAPTTSSTLMLAYGDGLAIAAAQLKGFSKEIFATNHPAGALGKILLYTVSSLMHTGSTIPFIAPDASFNEIVFQMTSKKLGLCVVAQPNQKLVGIITDGDLRRACALGATVFSKTATEIMTSAPKVVSPTMRAYEALVFMEKNKITNLAVVDDERVVGVIHIHDIMQAGISR